MTASERDSTKDFWPPPPFLSANFSAFNLNRHFLLTLGKAIGAPTAHLRQYRQAQQCPDAWQCPCYQTELSGLLSVGMSS